MVQLLLILKNDGDDNYSRPGPGGRDGQVRRLAAIMFTDIVGYTSLSQRSESLALELLERHRQVVRPAVARHNGREVKTMGDAFLVEFTSALEAARCAVKIQEALFEMNSSSRLPDQRISLRIGIHLGDVVLSQNDIYGDAVNVASRIEPLASPGGICLTRQVYDQIHNKFEFPIVPLGARELKNVEGVAEIYRIVLPWEEKEGKESGAKLSLDSRRVAVLPLVNMSPDPDDEYFSDGLTDELISTISQIKELRVISRTSIMQFKKTAKVLSEIGRELNVGTVLEGSVRRSGKKLRVTAQLIDVQTDEHIWAKNYDRTLEDVFAIQSDIAQNIASALEVTLVKSEKESLSNRAPTQNTEAYNLYLKGRYFWNNRTKENLYKAIECFKRATEKDPRFALAYVGIADCYSVLADHGHLLQREAEARAAELARKALQLDDSLAEARTSLGAALERTANATAEEEFRKAIWLNPNYATAHHWYAIHLLGRGKIEEALSETRKANELDPLSLQIKSFLGATYWIAKRYDEALEHLTQALEIDPNFGVAYFWLSLVYAETSRFDEAIAAAKRGAELTPGSRSKASLGYAYAVAGRREEALNVAEELTRESKNSFVSYSDIAVVYAGLGMNDKAIYWLQRADTEISELTPFSLTLRWFDLIRSDERFRALEMKVKGEASA